MKITKYNMTTEKPGIDLHLAVVSDLHARPHEQVLEALCTISPDLILLAGDILEVATDYMEARNKTALQFLQEAVKIAPCYYCYGNHEIYYSHTKKGQSPISEPARRRTYEKEILDAGIHMINDGWLTYQKDAAHAPVFIGGMVCGRDMNPDLEEKKPNQHFLSEFDKSNGYKLLLCHYPHYYIPYVKKTGVDLMFSGHAHGGQWRICGRGVYAPHQGLLPKYTSGLHDGRHIICRGAANNVHPIPRFFNPCEVLDVQITTIDK